MNIILLCWNYFHGAMFFDIIYYSHTNCFDTNDSGRMQDACHVWT